MQSSVTRPEKAFRKSHVGLAGAGLLLDVRPLCHGLCQAYRDCFPVRWISCVHGRELHAKFPCKHFYDQGNRRQERQVGSALAGQKVDTKGDEQRPPLFSFPSPTDPHNVFQHECNCPLFLYCTGNTFTVSTVPQSASVFILLYFTLLLSVLIFLKPCLYHTWLIIHYWIPAFVIESVFRISLQVQFIFTANKTNKTFENLIYPKGAVRGTAE